MYNMYLFAYVEPWLSQNADQMFYPSQMTIRLRFMFKQHTHNKIYEIYQYTHNKLLAHTNIYLSNEFLKLHTHTHTHAHPKQSAFVEEPRIFITNYKYTRFCTVIIEEEKNWFS